MCWNFTGFLSVMSMVAHKYRSIEVGYFVMLARMGPNSDSNYMGVKPEHDFNVELLWIYTNVTESRIYPLAYMMPLWI